MRVGQNSAGTRDARAAFFFASGRGVVVLGQNPPGRVGQQSNSGLFRGGAGQS